MSTTLSFTERFEAAQQSLADAEQSQVLRFYDELSDAGKDQLLTQVETTDWPEVKRLVQSHVLKHPEAHIPEHIEPAPYYAKEPREKDKGKYKEAKALGEDLIRLGKVAAFVVAGGQGTRLGFDGPKGTYPATSIRQATLFQLFAEQIAKAQQKYKAVVPWYVMTSTVNHEQTVAYFEANDYFGLDQGNVKIFSQGMMPAICAKMGKVLLSGKDSLALSPNGHGGSLKALYTSGALEDMKSRGVEHLSYFQVDNPNVKCVDPLFIGLHAMDESQMSSKMLEKAYPKEKLGNFCVVDGRVTVIEYSDLPDALAEARLPDGELKFRCGSIAIHAITVKFIESLNTEDEGFSLPYHRADKKVPFVDDKGELTKPDSVNAVKLETFVFDAVPLCETSVIYETDRVEEFAPIKNADAEGAVDCPATSMQLQSERAARWLRAKGVDVVKDDDGWVDAQIELRPVTAVDPEDLVDLELPEKIVKGEQILL